jgi:hypothetical protein
MAQIYKISIGKHYYIGSAKNLDSRKGRHTRDLLGNKHVNRQLQAVYNRSKKGSITFEALESVEDDKRYELEQKYLNECYTDPYCVNASSLAKGARVTYLMNTCWGKKIGEEDSWWQEFESFAEARRSTGAPNVSVVARDKGISTGGWVFIDFDPNEDPEAACETYLNAKNKGRSR